MVVEEAVSASRSKKRKMAYNRGPYILRTLINSVPLSAEGDDSSIGITCVELLDNNLYIGTSAAEILHFVLIPPDPSDGATDPTPILASRLQPTFSRPTNTQSLPGIQQILLLPAVNKALILCNGTLTFYSLPELSPAFANRKVTNCNLVGGVDLDLQGTDVDENDGVLVMISVKTKTQLVRISERLQVIRNIEYGGALVSVRRSSIACVANLHSYALLDVDHSQKIPLFPISSLDEAADDTVGGQIQNLSRDVSPARGHGRSTSLNALVEALGNRSQSPRESSRERSGLTPGPESRGTSPARSSMERHSGTSSGSQRGGSPEKPLPPPPLEASRPSSTLVNMNTPLLKPHVLSPTTEEFLLTTGTAPSEPGVGMFVNLDGDVVRGTIEFTTYPQSIVTDGFGAGNTRPSDVPADEEEGYVLAVTENKSTTASIKTLEIQRWDVDPGEGGGVKYWLPIQEADASLDISEDFVRNIGIRRVIERGTLTLNELSDNLRLTRLRVSGEPPAGQTPPTDGQDYPTKASLEQVNQEMELFESGTSIGNMTDRRAEEPLEEGWLEKRNIEEASFALRFSKVQSQIVVWSGDQIFWVVRNPLALRLDGQLHAAEEAVSESDLQTSLDSQQVLNVFNSIRGREPTTETEFVSLGYLRQKASLLVLVDVLYRTASEKVVTGKELHSLEGMLIDGGLDPRVVLAMIPMLRLEIEEGRAGIWIHAGVAEIADRLLQEKSLPDGFLRSPDDLQEDILHLFARYLLDWRRKKGFGSITDEKEVFLSVDAALLKVLLLLDARSNAERVTASSVRAELYSLVDHGFDDFDRAIAVLEEHKRLYVLSRLYQSRKMARKVLETWARMLDGEEDPAGDFVDGESQVRKYLGRVSDASTVEHYGTWLARRNPKLGVQVFADENSRVKFEPSKVVNLLKRDAPGAVQDYLEYLVFGKNLTQYANDLITFYLDNVVHELERSETARSIILQTYETYRALQPPKPTYHQFITDNAIPEEWWHSRLRLLQLLGGSYGAASQYDVPAIVTRIETWEKELVPEMIILDGRQGRHERALRLLTHGLGDFDTAVNYCLFGGSSIYQRAIGEGVPKEAIPSREEQARLFSSLLNEFLEIEDISERIERTSELLERFSGWFDVGEVLRVIPDSWSVEIVSRFLVSSLRKLVAEKSETMVTKALSASDNLKTSVTLIDRERDLGPKIEVGE